jgi:high affinity sulfate transporter 1
MTAIASVAPGLASLLRYNRRNAFPDLKAGLAVGAVALPVAVAYAELAGFSPEFGLYSSLLPLVAYAVFGSSRQLIVGPDAATCVLVFATVAPLAAGNSEAYLALSVTLAFLTGLTCIAASFLKLGALADFLSRPILVGFLNGVALSIVLGQIGKMLGFAVESGGILPRLWEVAGKLDTTHLPTLAVALASFAVLIAVPRVLPWLPAAVCAMALSIPAVVLLGLDTLGVKTIGPVSGGFPTLHLPEIDLTIMPTLCAEALGLVLVSFVSLALTARSFAARNGYDVDLDQDLAALGSANIASALSGGFVISGADSRTAMNDAAGGKTHAAGLVAASVILVVLLFFMAPLQYVPLATLGAVLFVAAISLVDVSSLRLFYSIHWVELALSLVVTVGVIVLGAIDAIFLAVLLALVRFIKLTSRPMVEILGTVDGMDGFHSLTRHPTGTSIRGVLLFRFNGPLVFFNAPYFRRELIAAIEAAGPEVRDVVIDLIPVHDIDATGLIALRDLKNTLNARGISLNGAGRVTEWREWANRHGFEFREVSMFPTLESAVDALSRHPNDVGRPRPLNTEVIHARSSLTVRSRREDQA